jgi:hypothetical protein
LRSNFQADSRAATPMFLRRAVSTTSLRVACRS